MSHKVYKRIGLCCCWRDRRRQNLAQHLPTNEITFCLDVSLSQSLRSHPENVGRKRDADKVFGSQRFVAKTHARWEVKWLSGTSKHRLIWANLSRFEVHRSSDDDESASLSVCQVSQKRHAEVCEPENRFHVWNDCGAGSCTVSLMRPQRFWHVH